MEQILLIVILIISVIAHEVSHGYAADWLGDPTARLSGRLTLSPIAHVDPVGSVIVPALLVLTSAGVLFGWAKPVPYNPYNFRNKRWGEAIVAGAGSFTNLLLALIFGLIARFTLEGLPVAGSVAALISFVNLFLGLFNLIPFPPMDGYTVLRGLLPFSMSYPLRQLDGQMRALGAGGIFIVLIIFTLVFSGPFFSLVASLFNLLVGV